jgi:hypothetical protein
MNKKKPATLQALASTLSKDDKAQVKFMKVFGTEYFSRPFGTTPKSELDLLVFRALIAAEQLDPNGPIFSIASALQITPAKARSLQMQYFLRANVTDSELSTMLAEVFEKTRPTIEKNDVRFGLEQTYLRAALEAKIKEQNIYADVSGEVLRIPKEHFGEAMAALLDPERRAAFERALKDSGVKVNDAAGFFSQLQKEFLDGVKGKALGAATDKVWEAFQGIFSGEGDYGTLIDGFRQILGG